MSEEIVISFAGVSHVIEAERLLSEAGFSAGVMPVPGAIGAGCGFCLRVPSGQAVEVCRWMRERGVPYSAVYAKEERPGGDVYVPFEAGGSS